LETASICTWCAFKQFSSGGVDRCECELKGDARLKRHQFCVGEARLRVKDEEIGFGTEFELMLIGGERFLCEVERGHGGHEESLAVLNWWTTSRS
jgi:hypothetical protein